MIGLVWNMVMSFGGGWFFVSASEAISVLNYKYTLPGIGSYVVEAISQQDMRAIVLAVVAMAVMIVITDQLVWRPLIAWSDKFKMEANASVNAPTSWFLNLLRAAQWPRRIGKIFGPVNLRWQNWQAQQRNAHVAQPPRSPFTRTVSRRTWRWIDRLFTVALAGIVVAAVAVLANFVLQTVHLGEVINTLGLGAITVLNDINLEVQANEIVSLLGKSGSGKSTLLRIMAGLIPPTVGQVTSSGKPVHGTNPDVAMVFQSYALLPWLTVQQNVEVGLEATGVPPAERQERALKAIDRVGLDGFESAYPKELSGGMKQRVGIARAFVMQPRVLFMDEPFSGLDVLTAENLRGEIADLWEQGNFPASSIVLVTHNIEEAVLLADRVIILGNNPGHVRGVFGIDLARPRDRNAAQFKALVDHIYTILTNPDASVTGVLNETQGEPANKIIPLPSATAGGISGLLELVVEHGGREDLPALASQLQFEMDDLSPITDAASLLGFATVSRGDITLTDIGKRYAEADIQTSKQIFRDQVMAHVPMMRSIVETLRLKKNGSMRAEFFLDILDEHFPREEAQHQFNTLVGWGRYAELFEYDALAAQLHL